MRIVAGATGPVAGVNEYGLKLEGPTSAGAGNEIGLEVATGWDIGLDLQSGGIQLANVTSSASEPAAPTAGNLRVYSRLTAGRSMLTQKGSSGVSYAFQPSLFQQNVMLVTPGGSAGALLTATGGQVASTGTLNTSIAGTQANGPMASYTIATVAPAGIAGANNQFFRGSIANGANGFFYFMRINLSDTLTNYTSATTGTRLFFGLTDQTAATMGASNTPLGNFVGFRFAPSADAGVMQFTSRDGTTQTQNTTSTTLAQNKTYDLYVYVKPNDPSNTLYWRIDNLTDGSTQEGTKTNNQPTSTVAMKPMGIMEPMTAITHVFQFQRMYVESDR